MSKKKKDRLSLLQPRKRKRRANPGPPQPAPEVIDGGEWKIVESPSVRTAGVIKNSTGPGGKIIVPLGDQEVARLVRAHELMHIHISPKVWPRPYNDDFMNMLEDGRVHKHLRSTGFELAPLAEVIDDSFLTEESLSKMHPAMLASCSISTIGTGEEERIREAIINLGRGDILAVADQVYDNHYEYKDRPSVEDLAGLADRLIEALGDPDEPPPPPPPPKPEPKPEDPPPPPPPVPEMEVEPPRKHTPEHGDGETGWGEMWVNEVPLTRRLPGKMRGQRRIVPDHRGRKLRRVGRLYVDGKVFGNRPFVPGGGAVLIDTSGSMGLTNDQVEQIVQALPGGIVATYSGSGDGTGELRIIAKNGRYCSKDNIQSRGQLNIIDGPALEWLSKQRGPRYWVSDGFVTGRNEQRSPLLVAHATRLCKMHHITRVSDMDALLGT